MSGTLKTLVIGTSLSESSDDIVISARTGVPGLRAPQLVGSVALGVCTSHA